MNVQQKTVETIPAKTIGPTVDKAIVLHAAVGVGVILVRSATITSNLITEHFSLVGLL